MCDVGSQAQQHQRMWGRPVPRGENCRTVTKARLKEGPQATLETAPVAETLFPSLLCNLVS